jgi:hypothetical protein
MIALLEGFKYLAAVIVALSVLGFGLVAFSFLAFCDHGPALACFLRMAAAIGIALAQVVILVRAWTLLKQRRRLRFAAGLMIVSIVPVPIAIVIFMRIPSWGLPLERRWYWPAQSRSNSISKQYFQDVAFFTGRFANMVYARSDWDYKRFDVDDGLQMATEKTSAALHATDVCLWSPPVREDRRDVNIVSYCFANVTVPDTRPSFDV